MKKASCRTSARCLAGGTAVSFRAQRCRRLRSIMRIRITVISRAKSKAPIALAVLVLSSRQAVGNSRTKVTTCPSQALGSLAAVISLVFSPVSRVRRVTTS